jgi:hypothetical protein
MKANTQSKAKIAKRDSSHKGKKVNWSELLPAINADIKTYNHLMDVLLKMWNKSDYLDPLKFRKDFVNFYVSLKTENEKGARAYANRVACTAGFRERDFGAGPKPKAEKSKAELRKTEISRIKSALRKLKLTRAEMNALILDLARI